MKKYIDALNSISPFSWALEKSGDRYTILCEDLEIHDPESGAYLTNMDRDTCKEWLVKLTSMTICS